MALTQVSTGGIKDGQVQTADLADGQVTVGKLHADALDHTYTLGADGSNHYTFTGEGLTGAVNDPTLYLTRGKTYRFVNGNSAGAHPFRIQTTVNGSAGTEYNTGVTNNGGAGGSTIVFEVPHDAPDVLYYQCTSHGSMGGILYVTGALADGTVTTAKIADSNVTTAKIADEAVTLAKLPHGTSSNDGKFLRANNGADPSFETVTSTTINNNADNRVITGSGTANTLNAESSVVVDSSGRVQIGGVTGPNNAKLFVAGTNSTNYMTFRNTSAGDGSGARWNNIRFQGTQSGGEVSDLVHLQANHDGTADDEKGAFEVLINDGNDGDSLNKRIRVDSDGLKFNSDTAAANALDDYEEGTFTCTITGSSSSPSYSTSSNGGFYVRIGKFVSLYFLMIVSSVSSQGSGNWQIEGLPFSHDNNVNSYRSIGIIGYNDIFDFEVHKLYATNGDKLLIIPNGVTQGNQTFSQNPMSTGYFGFSITYRTDS
jgi:hypothetical protein